MARTATYQYDYGNANFDPGPPRRRVLVTPSDTVDLAEAAPLLRFSGAGTVSVLLLDDADTVRFVETVGDGGQYVGAVRRVLATGTTASPTLKVYACYPS